MAKDDEHKYKKNVHGFELDAIDPIQDIMSDDEVEAATKKIENLLAQAEED
jgi:hypothetical protein